MGGRGHERFRTEQPPRSMLTRAIELDVLPTCQRYGIGVLTYSPLADGWLSGKYRKGQAATKPQVVGQVGGVPAHWRRAQIHHYGGAAPTFMPDCDVVVIRGLVRAEA